MYINKWKINKHTWMNHSQHPFTKEEGANREGEFLFLSQAH